ncbi:hypothetical protein LCGC14_0736630 [marine sediment metagenome]|uniref:ABC transporter domain-containing protein n=1 Tax=marine sediment metagenome TaxID=412755 RepID=A0A0F9Q7Z8_9ZZZZ|nr:ABC transporter ATP-binding protein [archaeon]HEC38071.1 ABC transporter ATP-binding protein [bacterium]
MTETVIKFENVTLKYGKLVAVNNMSLDVKKGEVIGFIGPNGAGKTTALKLLAKLLKPNIGKILVINKQRKLQNINKSYKNLIDMGFLIDIPHFYNTTPYRLLKYIATIRNYPKEKINQRIDYLLKNFNLFSWKYKKIKVFSKGMSQKLGFILAIIHEPEIIVLDEPQTGLDPNARIHIRRIIKFLQQKGKTIFVASHMLYEIAEICDKIALINNGSIIGFGSINNLENVLKSKEIVCKVLHPIPIEKVNLVTNNLIQRLGHYIESGFDSEISTDLIRYDPQDKSFIISYDGKEESRSNILTILVNEFKDEFTITSFSKPITSQLEKIYAQLIHNTKK